MNALSTTPGPWEVVVTPRAGGKLWREIVANGVAFVEVRSAGGDSREDAANARLIAAAPELYEALERAVEALEFARETTGLGQPAYVIAGERALAKARGEQP